MQHVSAPELSVVLPCFNDHRVLAKNVTVLIQFLKKLAINYEIILVDDGSLSAAPLQQLAQDIEAKLLRHSTNMGKGAALKTGISHSKGRWVFFTDSDVPYEPETLKVMLFHLKHMEDDICVGSRRLGARSSLIMRRRWWRKLGSRVFSYLVQRFFSVQVSDTQCGFKAFRGDIARELFAAAQQNGFCIDLEILIRAEIQGYKIREFPVRLRSEDGKSIRFLADGWKMILDLFKIRNNLIKN